MADDTGFMSVVNGLFAPGDPNAIDANTGISDAQRKQLAMSQMGSLGALLLAAGQRQMPAQRAQLLAQMGNIPQQANEQMLRYQQLAMQKRQQDAQQALLKLQTQKAQTELDREGRIAEDIKSNINNIPEALRPYALANPVDFGKIQASAKLSQMYRNPTEYDQKMAAALAATGGDKDMAAKLVSGALKIESDAAGNKFIVDVTKGTTTKLNGGGSVADFGLPPNPNAPMTPSQQSLIAPSIAPVAPYQGTPNAPAWAQEGYDPTQGAVRPNAGPYGNATIKPNLPYSDMFGFSGTYNEAKGKVQDLFFGQMSGQTAGVYNAMSQYGQARNDIIGALGVEIPGKNLKATQSRIAELLPQDAKLFRGPSESLKDFAAARDMLEGQIKDLYNIVEGPNFSRAEKGKAATAIQQLLRGRDNLSVMIDQMAPKKPQGQSKAGGSFSEGQTATNPKTGQKLIFRNGNWEPV